MTVRAAHKVETGIWGEQAAADYLQRTGYEVIDRNVRKRCGEIDLVARKQQTLYFIEVKTRSTTHFGLPREALSSGKLRRLERTIECYLSNFTGDFTQCALACVEILGTPHSYQISYLEHAP